MPTPDYFSRIGSLGGKARARKLSRKRQREIGRKAGLASAAGRMKKLTPAKRAAVARNAARVRWAKRAS